MHVNATKNINMTIPITKSIDNVRCQNIQVLLVFVSNPLSCHGNILYFSVSVLIYSYLYPLLNNAKTIHIKPKICSGSINIYNIIVT